MSELEMERIYTIPLRKVKAGSRNKMANRAVREIRSYLAKHMKSDDVWLDAAVNEYVWARGMYTVPSKIRVRAIKFDDGVVEVSLPEEEATTSIRESLKEERESRQPVLGTTTDDAEAALEGLGGDDDEDEPATDGTAEIEAVPEADDVGPGADTDAETPPEPKGADPKPEHGPDGEKAQAEEATTKQDPEGHADSEKNV